MGLETNLGIVTAYRYAQERGYNGTEEEFEDMLANIVSHDSSVIDSSTPHSFTAENYSIYIVSGDIEGADTFSVMMFFGNATITKVVDLKSLDTYSGQVITFSNTGNVVLVSSTSATESKINIIRIG